MTNFRTIQSLIANARTQRNASEDALSVLAFELRDKQKKLLQLERSPEQNANEIGSLKEAIKELGNQFENAKSEYQSKNNAAYDSLLPLFKLAEPQRLIENLDDQFPIALFPVRIETKFMNVDGGKELWVRIFPDEIAAISHEPELTPTEVTLGKTFWLETWKAKDETGKIGAWRNIVQASGTNRAAWVVKSTKPVNWDSLGIFITKEDYDNNVEYPPIAIRLDPKTRPTYTTLLPDKFVVIGYKNNLRIEATGNPIPDKLSLGPDPTLIKNTIEVNKEQSGDQITSSEIEFKGDIGWLQNFVEAEKIGMGIKMKLTTPFDIQGFDRLLVTGINFSDNEVRSAEIIEELIESHHYEKKGLAIIPQGTPTNNAEGSKTGFGTEDQKPEESYANEMKDPLFVEPIDNNEDLKADGQKLAEALGIKSEVLYHIQNAGIFDQQEAKAMNTALWNGTLGYFLDEMMSPLFSQEDIDWTFNFFTKYVSGRGSLPAIRVGRQPYGVLPTSVFRSWQWTEAETDNYSLNRFTILKDVLLKMENQWEASRMQVKSVDEASDSPYGNLLSILGLHSGSVSYEIRYSVGPDFLWNLLYLNKANKEAQAFQEYLRNQSKIFLSQFGITVEPRILSKTFFSSTNHLTGPVVDGNPLSEIKSIQSYDPADPTKNYIRWLRESGTGEIASEEFLLKNGTKVIRPYNSLLYLQLKNALQHSYWDSAMRFYVDYNVVDTTARREKELTNMNETESSDGKIDMNTIDLTKWDYLNADMKYNLPKIATVNKKMSDFLKSNFSSEFSQTATLVKVRDALKVLEALPTARLERLFAEHIDICSYRLDAWQTGFFTRRLQKLRSTNVSRGQKYKRGVYIGAYAWIENLQPKTDVALVPAQEVPEQLLNSDKGPIKENTSNGGYIQAPSVTHAVAAAVLRNGYLSHADKDNSQNMAVNLSSERVRNALFFIEGIRNGQDLAALLGYQFERGLHEGYPGLEMDQYIYNFRDTFPYAVKDESEIPPGSSIEVIAARNVVDGYKLLEAARLKDGETVSKYPYGVMGLPASGSERTAIEKEVNRLFDSFDAVGDLSISESVFQIVQGNYEAAGAMMKAISEGKNPPFPEIINTPRSGSAITNRVVLNLETDLDTAITSNNLWHPIPLSDRAKIEPGLNKWIAQLLPDPSNMEFMVVKINADGTEEDLDVVKIDQLNLQPIDLIYLSLDKLNQQGNELEDRIKYVYQKANGFTIKDTIKVNFEKVKSANAVSFFSLMPLLRSVQNIVKKSRPLNALDWVLPSESKSDDENPKKCDANSALTRVTNAKLAIDSLRNDLVNKLNEIRSSPKVFAKYNELADLLIKAAIFDLQQAIPVIQGAFNQTLVNGELQDSAVVADMVKVIDEQLTVSSYSNKVTFDLIQKANSVLGAIDRKLKDFTSAINKVTLPLEAKNAEQDVISLTESARALFGKSFNLIPSYSVINQGELQQAYINKEKLLEFHTITKSNTFIVDEWLQGISRVKERMTDVEMLILLSAEKSGLSPLAISPIQLPYIVENSWIAVEFPEEMKIERDYVSIAIINATNSFSGSLAGLIIDEWTEVIPQRKETVGIAMNYDQPNAEAPQTILLAISPKLTGSWKWNDLEDILNDTLDRAKRRAVEPDHLATTVYAQLLPAILSVSSSDPDANISINYNHNFLNLSNSN